MRLADLATVIRSKNAGPFVVTFDILFEDEAMLEAVQKSGGLTEETIGRAFAVSPNAIRDFAYYPFARAVKFSLRRPWPSGARHDSDVYGAQQYSPLLDLEITANGSVGSSVSPATVTACAATELRALLGDRFTTVQALRDSHGKDESSFAPAPPEAVAFVQSTEETSAVVRICARHKIPMIPFGAGSSLEGHVLAIRGGLSIDLSGMDKVLRVSAEDFDATVQAGVTREQLNRLLRDTGMFFPVDPGANATLGGMAATGASGTTTVRYGAMRENVLSLTVVLPDGRVIQTGRRARKSSAGYDLTSLIVGSEGTLGIITEMTIRLQAIPEQISAAVCEFLDLKAAIGAVVDIIQCGLPIARVEFLDPMAIRAINRHSQLAHSESYTLFLEFHGSTGGVAEQIRVVEAVVAEHGGEGPQWASRLEDRTKLWQARHNALPAALHLRPGSKAITTDVCVPISRLADCIAETEADIARTPMPIVIIGHVGDGNFHLIILIDPERDDERASAEVLNERLVRRAIAMEGTCTGEHGIGLGKIDFLRLELGEAVNLMAAIKSVIDPDQLMNPGKILSARPGAQWLRG